MSIPESLSELIRIRQNNPDIIRIQSWINSNSNSIEKNIIWRVGICNRNDLRRIEERIRTDRECKHFKYWAMEDFQESVQAISHLTKSKSIFKSPHHKYTKTGNLLFAYKIPCPYTHNFHHALSY